MVNLCVSHLALVADIAALVQLGVEGSHGSPRRLGLLFRSLVHELQLLNLLGQIINSLMLCALGKGDIAGLLLFNLSWLLMESLSFLSACSHDLGVNLIGVFSTA